MEKSEPNKSHKPDNFETGETKALSELLADPFQFTYEIKTAVNSGNLDPRFVEKHLHEVIDEARRVNSINEQELQAQGNIDKKTLKQKLLVKLATFEGSEKELSKILKSFCENHNLELFPKKNWAVAGIKDSKLETDWVSNDKKFAIVIAPDKVFVYSKVNSSWIGLPL